MMEMVLILAIWMMRLRDNKVELVMKKILIITAICSTFAAIVSCNKEIEQISTPDQEDVTLIFASEKPVLFDEAETKTFFDADSKSIKWSKADKIRVAIKVGDNWQTASGDANPNASENPTFAKLYESIQAGEDASFVNFKVPATFNLSTSGEYKFYAFYPHSLTSSSEANKYMPSVGVTIPVEQTPGVGSFDPAADVMTAVSVGEYTGIPEDRIVQLDWTRQVAHGDITLKKLPSFESDEIIRSISIEAQEGADLVGYHYLDMTTGVFTLPNNATPVNSILIKAKDNNLAKNSDGNIEFWFSSLPFTATSLKVTITTNKYIYTKAYTGISKEFKKNNRNILGISMSNCSKTDAPTEQLIQNGVYVLSTGDVMMAANPDASYQNSVALSTTFEDGKMLVEDDAAWRVTFDNDNAVYYIQSVAYETYLGGLGGASSSNLSLVSADKKVGFTIEESGDGYHIIGTNSRWIGHNSGTNPARFAMYSNDANQPGVLTFTPAKFDETPVLEIADITLGSASAVTEPTTITPTTQKNIASIVVNGVYSDKACTTAANWLSVSYSNGSLIYTAQANANSTARTAFVSVKGKNSSDVATANVVFSVTQPKFVSYSDKWVLVTKVEDIAAGDKIVIVNTGGTKALGTTQAANNRGAVDVTLNADDKNIVNITNDTQQITLGKTNDHWTFSVGSGYLYAASSSANYLRTQTTNDANGEWTIVLNASYEATITAQGSNTRNVLQNNGNIFACYASASQTAVKIYKYYSDERPAAPISWSDEVGLADITDDGVDYELPTFNNTNSLAVSYDSSDKTVATIDEDGTVSALKAGTTIISATYDADAASTFKTTTVVYELEVTDSRSGGEEVNASLTKDEIIANITDTKCAYGTVKTYTDTNDGITWGVDCNTDAAGRPWMQMKSGSGYIHIVANGEISSVTLSISNANNSSGGITDITKHGDFTGTVSLSSAASSGTTLASGTPSNKSITLSPSGSPSEVYVLVSGAVRIWDVDVTYTSYN